MGVLVIGLLVTGAMATLLVLAVAVVVATDRLRATADRLVAVRTRVEPELRQLQEAAAVARSRAERLRRTRAAAGDA